MLELAATLELPRHQPAQQRPHQSRRPPRQHIRWPVHSHVDSADADEPGHEKRHAEEINLDPSTAHEAHEQAAEGEIDDRGHHRMAAWETGGVNVGTMLEDLRPRAVGKMFE